MARPPGREPEAPGREPKAPGREPEAIDIDDMAARAEEAAQFLRSLANPHRLLILCHLTHGEASVSYLERELGMRQAHLSQHLARLRQDGLVTTRRDARTIYYSIGSEAAADLVTLTYRLFCAGPDAASAPAAATAPSAGS